MRTRSPSESSGVAEPADDAHLRAKELFDQGVAALAAQRWLDAEDRFRRSAELVPRSSSLYNLALALFEQHRYRDCVEVSDRMLATADEQDVARFREPAARLREKALALAAIYLLTIDPRDANVTLDGKPVAGSDATRKLVLDPGMHRIAASAPGHAERVLALEVASGEQSSGTLALAPFVPSAPQGAPSATPHAPVHGQAAAVSDARERESSSPVPAIVLLSAGGAALVAALVTGLLANDADNEFTRKCGGVTNCSPSLKPLQQRTEDLALATDVLLGAGIALGGVGLTLLLVNDGPGDSDRSEAEVALRGFGAAVGGVW